VNWRRDVIGIVAVGGFTAVCVIILRGGVIDGTMKEVALVLLGQLAGAATTVVNYHYGSSAGSAAKDQAVTETAKAAAIAVSDTAKAAAAKVP
jgi:hypothetical protein